MGAPLLGLPRSIYYVYVEVIICVYIHVQEHWEVLKPNSKWAVLQIKQSRFDPWTVHSASLHPGV